MLKLLLALLPVAVILLVSEVLWRKKIVKGERARKFIHILAGVWMAFWPQYLPLDAIVILGVLAVNALLYSRMTGLFHAIYAVKRRTYGEVFFALSLALCAIFANEGWIFTVSILFMALADGGAAVVGRFWGVKNRYYVFGSRDLQKSVAGTLTFIALVYVSLFAGAMIGGGEVIREHPVLVLGVLPIIATAFENASPYGLDNVLTPVFATLFLNSLL